MKQKYFYELLSSPITEQFEANDDIEAMERLEQVKENGDLVILWKYLPDYKTMGIYKTVYSKT